MRKSKEKPLAQGPTVLMLNINYGRNKELLKSCRPLGEYSLFIESVRKHMREEPDRGQAEGRAEERKETARRMIVDGLSNEKVAQYSGLSLEEVQRLAVGK